MLLIAGITACQNKSSSELVHLSGNAQGSTFSIKYLGEESQKLANSVDSIFKAIDFSLSTYNKESLITSINNNPSSAKRVDKLFEVVYLRSVEIAQETNGAFDPTVGPLIDLWGFGLEKHTEIDSTLVDSVKAFIGIEKSTLIDKDFVMPTGFTINFNAIAQGYTVDVLADFLESKGIVNYFVEVGGETRAKGKNLAGKVWRVGIDKPEENLDAANRLQGIVSLKNKALATSGNYRKFWVDERTGEKYAHTLNPETGYPAKNNLLSVSVIAKSTMDADAYATASMVMGLEKSEAFIESKKDLEAMFIYTKPDGSWGTFTTSGFEIEAP